MSRTMRSNMAQRRCDPPVTSEAMTGQENSEGRSQTSTGGVRYSVSPEKTRNGERESKDLTSSWENIPNAALFAATFNPPASSGFLDFIDERNSTNFRAKSSRSGSTFIWECSLAGTSPGCTPCGTTLIASKIVSGLPVISFAAITPAPVIQNGCFEVRKFHASVGSESARSPNFARIGTTSSFGSTSPYQRRCFQNAGRKQSSSSTRSTI